MGTKTLVAEQFVDLRKAGVRGVLVDWSVTCDGSLSVLTARRMPDYRMTRPDGVNVFQTYSPRANFFTVHMIQGSSGAHFDIPATRENFTEIRQLDHHRILLVRGRRRVGESAPGAVFDFNGRERRRLPLGDFVQHICVAPNRSLWIGYGDEAWMKRRSRGGGVAFLDRNARMLFSLNESKPALSCIDCYAMSGCADGSVHVLCYPDFRLLHISTQGRVRVLPKPPGEESHTLVVAGNTALTDGGYNASEKYYLTNLAKRRKQLVSIVTPRGRLVRANTHFSIAGVLYLRERTSIHAVRLP